MNTLEVHKTSGPSGSAFHASAEPHSISELEHLINQQREQLSAAVQYLQEAAYLAHYHQPSLERNIRAFLTQIES